MHYIYGLFDPRDGQIRYIGRTVNPTTRLKEHCLLGQAGARRNEWVLELRQHGLKPDMQELDTADDETVTELETFYIGYFRMLGANLTNGNGSKPFRKTKAKVQMMMRIDEELLEQIDELSAKQAISRSAWISWVCSKEINKTKAVAGSGN